MSVLIKGMNMPSSCAKCSGYRDDGVLGLCVLAGMYIDDDAQIDPDCPLVGVKETNVTDLQASHSGSGRKVYVSID